MLGNACLQRAREWLQEVKPNLESEHCLMHYIQLLKHFNRNKIFKLD